MGYSRGKEAGSYLRLIDPCITQLKAQGRSRTCNESKEEEEAYGLFTRGLFTKCLGSPLCGTTWRCFKLTSALSCRGE